jgi:hypothetical protein
MLATKSWSELCVEHNHRKACEDLSNSKNMVFFGKKLLKNRMDLIYCKGEERSNASEPGEQHVLRV